MKDLMNEIDGPALLSDMIEATQRTVTANWTQLRPFVELESTHILNSIVSIMRLKEEYRITETQASLQLAIQKEAYASLLLTVGGVKRIQVENAINAGLSVIRETVNRLLGWSLL